MVQESSLQGSYDKYGEEENFYLMWNIISLILIDW